MIIYRLFCRKTGKAYIGATTQTLKARMHRHHTRTEALKDPHSGYPLYVDARLHGWDSFDVDVLYRPRSLDELQQMEKAAILLYRSLVPNGYNQILEDRDKGKWGRLTLQPGRNKGIPQSAEARAKMSASHMGSKNHRARAFEYQGIVYPCMQDCCKATGLTRNQFYTKLKHGEAKYLTPGRPGNYGAPHYHHTDATRQRMSDYRKAHHPRRRAILLDGVTYPSITAAIGVSGYSHWQIKRKLKTGGAAYVAH